MEAEPPTERPPPPAPGIVAEYIRSGEMLFRCRSYAPLLVLAVILAGVALDPYPMGGGGAVSLWIGASMLLGAIGLFVRAWALGKVPCGTSSRGTAEPKAETLNTRGLYSVVRHPLYLGNFFLWMGIAALGGHLLGLSVTLFSFWLYYERVIMAEERFLLERFGPQFREWADRTPAFVPALHRLQPSDLTFSIRAWIGRDYPAVYGFVAASTAVVVVRSVQDPEVSRLSGGWIAYLTVGTLLYGVARIMKRRTRLLEVAGR